MSAQSFIAFYGLRFEVGAEELGPLEERTDHRLIAARKNGLEHYWGNFGAPNNRYLLFVGKKIAVLGAENGHEACVSGKAFRQTMEDTEARLKKAGFEGTPSLIVQWAPDA